MTMRTYMRQALLKWTNREFDATVLFKLSQPAPHHVTSLGCLYATDCMRVLPRVREGVADTILQTRPSTLVRSTAATPMTIFPTSIISTGANNGSPSVPVS